jgi:hypothetical protein
MNPDFSFSMEGISKAGAFQKGGPVWDFDSMKKMMGDKQSSTFLQDSITAKRKEMTRKTKTVSDDADAGEDGEDEHVQDADENSLEFTLTDSEAEKEAEDDEKDEVSEEEDTTTDKIEGAADMSNLLSDGEDGEDTLRDKRERKASRQKIDVRRKWL